MIPSKIRFITLSVLPVGLALFGTAASAQVQATARAERLSASAFVRRLILAAIAGKGRQKG